MHTFSNSACLLSLCQGGQRAHTVRASSIPGAITQACGATAAVPDVVPPVYKVKVPTIMITGPDTTGTGTGSVRPALWWVRCQRALKWRRQKLWCSMVAKIRRQRTIQRHLQSKQPFHRPQTCRARPTLNLWLPPAHRRHSNHRTHNSKHHCKLRCIDHRVLHRHNVCRTFLHMTSSLRHARKCPRLPRSARCCARQRSDRHNLHRPPWDPRHRAIKYPIAHPQAGRPALPLQQLLRGDLPPRRTLGMVWYKETSSHHRRHRHLRLHLHLHLHLHLLALPM